MANQEKLQKLANLSTMDVPDHNGHMVQWVRKRDVLAALGAEREPCHGFIKAHGQKAPCKLLEGHEDVCQFELPAAEPGDLCLRITDYLSKGGLFNPELMEHDKVRQLLIDCRESLLNLSDKLRVATFPETTFTRDWQK